MERTHIQACIVSFDVPRAAEARKTTLRSIEAARKAMPARAKHTISCVDVTGEAEAIACLRDPGVDAVLVLRAGETLDAAGLALVFTLAGDDDEAIRGAVGQLPIVEVVGERRVRRIEPRLFRRGARPDARPRVHVAATLTASEPSSAQLREARRERLFAGATPEHPDAVARIHTELAELFVADDPSRSLEHASAAVDLGDPDSPDAARAALALGDALLAVGAAEDVVALTHACAARWPKFTELAFLRFQAERAAGRIDAVRDALIACLQRGEDERFPGTVGAGTFVAAYELGLWLESAGDRAAARRFYEGAAPDCPSAAARMRAIDFASSTAAPRELHRSDWVVTRDTRHGTMSYFVHDTFVGRSLDLYGEWCSAETDFVTSLVGPGDVVVDVGANIGTLTLSLATAVGTTGRVIAYEPQSLVHSLLATNAATNGASQIECVHAAVGDVTGDARIPKCIPERASNVGAAAITTDGADDDVEIVEVQRIDDLALAACHLLKIDAEGFEPKVLEGARKTIEAHRPYLFVENDTIERSAVTLAALHALGYRAFWHVARYYRPDNFYGNANDVFSQFQPQANLIAVPAERDIPAQVRGLVPVLGDDDDFVKAIGRGALSATLATTPVNEPVEAARRAA